MTSAGPKRSITELPSDPARLHLHYGHGHPAVPYDFEDTLASWYVTVTYGLAGDEEWDDKEDGESHAPAPGYQGGAPHPVEAARLHGRQPVGGRGRRVRRSRGHSLRDPWPIRTRRLQRCVRESSHPARRPVLAVEAIRRLCGGCCAIAVYPAMGEYPEDREPVSEAYRWQAKKKIAALWQSIGFQPFRRGVWLLDTALRQPEELLRARRAELHVLSAAFQRPGPSESNPAGMAAAEDGIQASMSPSLG